MRHDLDFLPDRQRRELQLALRILFESFEAALGERATQEHKRHAAILKVVLFGSVARGQAVEDRGSGYMSDYDLLVVVNDERLTDQHGYWDAALDRFVRELTVSRTLQRPVNFIVHSLKDLNRQLERGRPFFLDVVRDGIMLYEAEGYPLERPRVLPVQEARQEALEYFTQWFPSAFSFLRNAQYARDDQDTKLAAFLLHQATERLYHCVLLVLTLYSPKSQQIVDLNTRVLPGPGETRRVLLLLDEFARLGAASVLAHGFSFIAGYGLRILAVLQSPSQLRAAYGPDLAQEIVSNCGVEIAFTPKELTIAKELSERLGYDTVDGRSRSRPAGFGKGGRSVTESDHRRALMLPQELLQMPKDRLLVLRAGIAPVLGEKLVYWRDRAFTPRLLAPPKVLPRHEVASTADLRALAVDVAGIRAEVEELRERTVERPMTAQEAAGETSLSDAQVSLALEEVDMDDLPTGALGDAEILDLLRVYARRASEPTSGPDRSLVAEVEPTPELIA